MKYTPRKVFIIESNRYIEITYEELCRRVENENTSYKDKLFIPLHGMLMEVTEDAYKDFYKEKRRQKYLKKQAEEHGDISYDMLTTDDFNGENILIDDSVDIAAQVENRIMTSKLRQAILTLPDNERILIHQHFFEEKSQVELSCTYGISQSNISRRISKILKKLKKILEN